MKCLIASTSTRPNEQVSQGGSVLQLRINGIYKLINNQGAQLKHADAIILIQLHVKYSVKQTTDFT